MPSHDIIDNRKQKLVDHINRIQSSTEASREPGKIRLVARAEGLKEASVEIDSQRSTVPATLP